MNLFIKIIHLNIIILKKDFFFGYFEYQPNIYYAFPEKALLDLIYKICKR